MKLLIGAVVCGGVVVWEVMARRARRHLPMIAYEPRRPVPWGANDLVLTLMSVVLLGIIARVTVDRFYAGQPAGTSTPVEICLSSAIELCGVAIGIAWIRYQAGATWADLGLDTSRLARNLGLGAAAFLASVVPIFALQSLLLHWVDYKHPLIEQIHAQPDMATFVSTAVAALVAAPLFEEFIFRVLLQGWFEAIEVKRRVMRLGVPGEGPAWWPIVLSALLFALMHLGQGAAPIPLFLFAIVLGYLYQRTHRIWPSMVAHLLLNAATIFILWNQIQHASA
jgi:membrane protease YdiL (CAAX protease family)